MTVLFASLSARIAMVFGLALAVISVAMLSEYWGGLIPCALCLKQRVAFFVAVPLLALAYIYAPRAPLAMRGLLSTIGIVFLANAGLGFYHAGIEYGWWLGRLRAAAAAHWRSIRARFSRLCKTAAWCAVMPQPSPYSGFHWPVIMSLPVWFWPDWLYINRKRNEPFMSALKNPQIG